jgi:hypothetical protein
MRALINISQRSTGGNTCHTSSHNIFKFLLKILLVLSLPQEVNTALYSLQLLKEIRAQGNRKCGNKKKRRFNLGLQKHEIPPIKHLPKPYDL